MTVASVTPRLPTRTARAVRLGPASLAAIGMASVVGLIAFVWPLIAAPDSNAVAHAGDAPVLFAVVVPVLLLVVLAQVNDGGMDAKSIAMLGVLSAVIAALRPLGGGTAGLEPIWVVLILGGRALGPGFGFCLGSISLFASALLTGGVGPWLPFQMLGAAWVGMGAGLLPRASGRRELLLLSAYGAVACVAYGFLLNLWFWPFTAGLPDQLSFVAGAPMSENLLAWLRFCLVTSLGYDIPRAILSVVLIMVAGRPVLAALRRMSRKAAFDAPIEFVPAGELTVRVAMLGTGSADGWPNPFCACTSCESERREGRHRQPSAALVDDAVLIDCGPTTPHAAASLGSGLRNVEHVLITHGHPDHLHPAFLLTRAWVDVGHDLHVWAPRQALDLCRDWVGPDSRVVLNEVAPGQSLELHSVRGTYEVAVVAAAHASGNGDVLAEEAVLYAVVGPDGSRLLYATDTAELPDAALASIAGAFDLVIIDETFGDAPDHDTGHLDLASLPRVLDALRTRGAITDGTTVVATHLSHHNPPSAELADRLATIGVCLVDDLTVLDTDSPTPGPGSPDAARHLVLGGARSGKSRFAEGLAADAAHVTYVATGGTRPDDAEWQSRVRAHQERRPPTWRTVETIDLAGVLAAAEPGSLVLVDCIALWLTGQLDAVGAWTRIADGGREEIVAGVSEQASLLIDALGTSAADVILVSNEVGMGVVPETASGRLFQDLLGIVNARLAAACEQVTLVTAGLPMTLKHPSRTADSGA